MAMWKVAIVSSACGASGTDADRECNSRFYERPLPVFYMSDYSVIGLKVDRMDDSLGIMGEHGFSVQDEGWGPEVILEDPSHLPKIMDALAARGVTSQIADLVDGLYQG